MPKFQGKESEAYLYTNQIKLNSLKITNSIVLTSSLDMHNTVEW